MNLRALSFFSGGGGEGEGGLLLSCHGAGGGEGVYVCVCGDVWWIDYLGGWLVRGLVDEREVRLEGGGGGGGVGCCSGWERDRVFDVPTLFGAYEI